MPNPNPINLAVLGLGRAGWRIHLDGIKDDPRFRVAAVADPDPARQAEAVEAFGCQAFGSVEELTQVKELELIVVATPSASHAGDAAKVLRAGHHCLVEKPVADTYREAADLVKLASQSGKHLFVHHQLPFRAEYQNLRQVVDGADLGRIFHLQTIWASYARRWDWQTLAKNGGGLLNNHATHALSLVLPLLDGPVVSVAADLRNIKDAGDAEDHVNLLLKTASGQTASLLVTTACALPGPKWMIMGSCGAFSSDGANCTLRYYDPREVPSLEVIDATAPGRAYQSEQLPWQERIWKIEAGGKKDGFYTNIYQVLRENAPVYVTPESALEVVRVIELARAAAK